MTAPTFIDQLRITVATMQAEHPAKADTISRAHAAIVEGHVVDLGDGFGKVLSRNRSTWYTCNGTCDCTAATYGKVCRHLQAWKLYQHVHKRFAAQPTGPAAVEAPVAATVAPSQEPAPGTTPLPEAPASVNCHLTIAGRQVQLTLRDQDEGRLLARLEAVLQRFPQPQTPAQPASQEQGWCAIHNVSMKVNHKDGRTWYSHRTSEGFCKGRR